MDIPWFPYDIDQQFDTVLVLTRYHWWVSLAMPSRGCICCNDFAVDSAATLGCGHGWYCPGCINRFVEAMGNGTELHCIIVEKMANVNVVAPDSRPISFCAFASGNNKGRSEGGFFFGLHT